VQRPQEAGIRRGIQVDIAKSLIFHLQSNVKKVAQYLAF